MNSTMVRGLVATATALLALCAAGARADGLAELKAALVRLQAQAPVKATLDVQSLERHGEGKDVDERVGQASVTVEDSARGLQVTYSRELVARMDVESRQKGRDPQAKTPTLWALGRLDSSDIDPMVSAVSTISRWVDESVFEGERIEPWQGRPARRLSFKIPVTKLPDAQRKYVKDFDGTLEIWIAADGTPLASASRAIVKGRAFVVVSFEAHDESDATYGVVGDRLLTLRRETRTTSAGAGERSELRVVRTLQLAP
jgi:hypothetical protein